jgi:hypothetical protein
MNRIIKSTLIAIAAISGVTWVVASGFMTVYFRAGMVADWGEEFTKVVEWVFAFGWMVPIAVLTWIDMAHTKRRRTV